MNRKLVWLTLIVVVIFGALSLNPASVQASATNATATPTAITARVLAYRLNVRADGSVKANKVGLLKYGDVVTVLGRNAAGTWLKIQSPTVTGWVRASFVRVTGSTVKNLPVVS